MVAVFGLGELESYGENYADAWGEVWMDKNEHPPPPPHTQYI